MSDGPERIWRLVDPATGHFEDYAGCPDCAGKDDVISQLERDARTMKGRLTRLERNKDDEDRRHPLWTEAEAIYGWWIVATGHFRSTFSVEDFRHMRPRLKEADIGPIGLLHAIAGAARYPHERPMPNGRIEKYDSIELICRERERVLNFQNRAPGNPAGHEWKRWLIDRIESNLVVPTTDA
jgi:hypothetical protein